MKKRLCVASFLVVATASSAMAQTDRTPAADGPVRSIELHQSGAITAVSKKMIVCNKAQARSFINFIQTATLKKSPAEQATAIRGDGRLENDGRLCHAKVLNDVHLGDVVDSKVVNETRWEIRGASRYDPISGRNYSFFVVGTAETTATAK